MQWVSTDEGDPSRFVVFASDDMLRQLANAHTLYADGTFKIIGEPFSQLFGIHARVKKGKKTNLIPVLFAPMTRRRAIDYRKLIQTLQKILMKNGLRLKVLGYSCSSQFLSLHKFSFTFFFLIKVKRIVADFESSFWRAVKEELPWVKMLGCAFHFTQLLTRRLKALGLQSKYRKDPETRRIYRYSINCSCLYFFFHIVFTY